MKRILAVLATAGVALLAASSASAQVPVDGFVVILGGHAPVGHNNTASCDTLECSVTVPIGNRDFNRLTKTDCATIAGFPTFDVTVTNPSSGFLLSNTIFCASTRYTIQVQGQYRNDTETSPVLIHVTVTAK